MTEDDARKLSRNRHFFRFWMPYLFQKVEVDGVKWAFVPLNRNYVPLGMTTINHIAYQDYAISHGVRFSRNPADLQGVWDHFDRGGERLWLYGDGPKSRMTYFQRLEMIMARSLPILAPKSQFD